MPFEGDAELPLERAYRRDPSRSSPGRGLGRAVRGEAGVPPYATTSQILAAQDEERRRIARELHDGTASTLVALSLDLTRLVESLPAGEHRELAAACASLCEQSLRELRAAAFVLHPPLLEQAGLSAALRWLAEGFSKRSGIQVTFEGGAEDSFRLGAGLELALYRIVQEALTNVLRHSGSRTARVVLETSADEVRLTVTDEGGASPRPRASRGGVGIASMRERVRALGGRLTLDLRRSGSVLSAVVPRC